MRFPRRLIAFVVVAATSAAAAQPSQVDRARALELFRDSDAHYKRGEFEAAVALLRQAYALHPEPLLLYNLGRALEGLGDLGGAIEAYEGYLNAETEIADRGAIERRIATLKAQRDAPTTPDPAAGARTAGPSADSPTTGQIATIEARSPLPQPVDSMQAGPRRLPWLIAGGGGVVLGAGAYFGYLARARHDDAVAEPSQVEAAALQDRAETYATVATSALVVGGLAVAGGVVWGLLDRRRERATPARIAAPRLELGPRSIRATWTFP